MSKFLGPLEFVPLWLDQTFWQLMGGCASVVGSDLLAAHGG